MKTCTKRPLVFFKYKFYILSSISSEMPKLISVFLQRKSNLEFRSWDSTGHGLDVIQWSLKIYFLSFQGHALKKNYCFPNQDKVYSCWESGLNFWDIAGIRNKNGDKKIIDFFYILTIYVLQFISKKYFQIGMNSWKNIFDRSKQIG